MSYPRSISTSLLTVHFDRDLIEVALTKGLVVLIDECTPLPAAHAESVRLVRLSSRPKAGQTTTVRGNIRRPELADS